MSKFDVKKHLIRVQGGREYLPVAYRLVWFREEHSDFGIATSPIVIDAEKGYAVFHATVTDAEGRTLAEGTKMETARGFADYCEKAETGAIGRALGVLGYGTQFAPEFDEGVERIVDSPVPLGDGKPSIANIGPNIVACEECGKVLTKGQQDLSQRKYGRPLCPAHQTATVPK